MKIALPASFTPVLLILIVLGAAGGVGVANSNSLATQDVGGTSGTNEFTDAVISAMEIGRASA